MPLISSLMPVPQNVTTVNISFNGALASEQFFDLVTPLVTEIGDCETQTQVCCVQIQQVHH